MKKPVFIKLEKEIKNCVIYNYSTIIIPIITVIFKIMNNSNDKFRISMFNSFLEPLARNRE